MKGKATGRGTIQNCRKQNWILAQTICCMIAVLIGQTFQPPWTYSQEPQWALLAAGTRK